MVRKKFLMGSAVGLIALLVVTLGVVGWKYYQVARDINKTAAKTSQRIVQAVAKIYLVPGNEQPTVHLIQDKNKLGNQEFFKRAENGDYILIYQKAKVALVYRQRSNQLINIGPVSGGDQGQTAGAQTNASPTD